MSAQQLKQGICTALIVPVNETDPKLLPNVAQLLASRGVTLCLHGLVVLHYPAQPLDKLCRHSFCFFVGGALEELLLGLSPTMPLPHAVEA